MSSFCTNRRISKCSHRFTMLRFHRFASHKNNLIISDFLRLQSSDEFFLHESADIEMLT